MGQGRGEDCGLSHWSRSHRDHSGPGAVAASHGDTIDHSEAVPAQRGNIVNNMDRATAGGAGHGDIGALVTRGGVERLDRDQSQRPVIMVNNCGPARVAGPDYLPPDHHPPGPGVMIVIIGDPGHEAPVSVLLGVAITQTRSNTNTETDDTEGDEAVVAAVTSHTPHLADH